MAIMGPGGTRRHQGGSAEMRPMNGGPIQDGVFPMRTKRRKGRQELTWENRDERGSNVGYAKSVRAASYPAPN